MKRGVDQITAEGPPSAASVFELLGDPVAVFDANTGAPVFLNAAAKALAAQKAEKGYPLTDIQSWTTKPIDHFTKAGPIPNTVTLTHAGTDTVRTTEVDRFDLTLGDKSFDVRISGGQLDMDRPALIAVLRDMSERAEGERRKRELVSTVSHELRSPLTAIKGAMGLVLSGAVGEIPNRVNDMITIAHRNADRLILIINDILDLDKIADGAMVFDNVNADVSAMVQDAVEAVSGFRDRFDVSVALDCRDADLVSFVDPNRIVQVLVNLLSNAIKFSPAGAQVTVRVQRYGDRHRISVIDQGEGIAEADQKALFERFVQVGAKNRAATGGTGLGLSIVQAILEGQNGQISFNSAVGQGTTFHVDLPGPDVSLDADIAERA